MGGFGVHTHKARIQRARRSRRSLPLWHRCVETLFHAPSSHKRRTPFPFHFKQPESRLVTSRRRVGQWERPTDVPLLGSRRGNSLGAMARAPALSEPRCPLASPGQAHVPTVGFFFLPNFRPDTDLEPDQRRRRGRARGDRSVPRADARASRGPRGTGPEMSPGSAVGRSCPRSFRRELGNHGAPGFADRTPPTGSTTAERRARRASQPGRHAVASRATLINHHLLLSTLP